jgi:hypothetical protein
MRRRSRNNEEETTFDPEKLKVHNEGDYRTCYLTYDGAIVAVRSSDENGDSIMRFVPSEANEEECNILRNNWETVIQALGDLGHYAESGVRGIIQTSRLLDYFNNTGYFVPNRWSRSFLLQLERYLPIDTWSPDDFKAAVLVYDAYESCLKCFYEDSEAREFGYKVPIALSLFFDPIGTLRSGKLIEVVTLINNMLPNG